MASRWAFDCFALLVIVAAWRVVTSPDIVRSVLWLVVVLSGMAPLFLLLAGEFVAVAQILVYVGAVVVLFLFGIMLTRSPSKSAQTTDDQTHTHASDVDNHRRWPGALIAAGLFVCLWTALDRAFGFARVAPSSIGRTADVGAVLLRTHVMAFEAVSVLLLATLIGAVVLARRD